jgi:predicted sulfurtransferase
VTPDQELLAPVRRITVTVGEDVKTVHALDGCGNPVCGAVGKLTEWQRTVSCGACLEAPSR